MFDMYHIEKERDKLIDGLELNAKSGYSVYFEIIFLVDERLPSRTNESCLLIILSQTTVRCLLLIFCLCSLFNSLCHTSADFSSCFGMYSRNDYPCPSLSLRATCIREEKKNELCL